MSNLAKRLDFVNNSLVELLNLSAFHLLHKRVRVFVVILSTTRYASPNASAANNSHGNFMSGCYSSDVQTGNTLTAA
jgi:hypothetical protein